MSPPGMHARTYGVSSSTPLTAASSGSAAYRYPPTSAPPYAPAHGGPPLHSHGAPLLHPAQSPEAVSAASSLVQLLMSLFSAVANLPLLFSRIVVTVVPPAHRLPPPGGAQEGGGYGGDAMLAPGVQRMGMGGMGGMGGQGLLTAEQLLRRVQELESQVERLSSGPSTPATRGARGPIPTDWPQPAVERVTLLESELVTTKKMLKDILESQEQLRSMIEMLQAQKNRRFGGCFG
eukprot:TRINITY_DN2760_c0_g2_i1.p1 TRINITY_DN2760_c0_g2~~TRINITY_DN2760_c0_g2_i1.p1  ORF type:complete len:257 (-),score=-10.65 TRINITY_DN2760_c0_g2_i1:101-802(-)